MVIRVLWAAIYIVGGALPAFGLALLSSFLMMSGIAFGIILNSLAWLGGVGLGLAALNTPSATGSCRRRIVSTMLIMGLIAISPVLLISLSHPSDKIWFNAAVAGPTLLALIYLGQTAWISNSDE
jgi:signal transduction histidine kinase